MELPATTSAPGAARAFVRDQWTDIAGPEVLDAIDLCVSELVTNALDHALPPYRLRLRVQDQALRIEVDDATVERPVVQSRQPSDARGRGMYLVDQVCRAWGVVPSATGKTVWAEF